MPLGGVTRIGGRGIRPVRNRLEGSVHSWCSAFPGAGGGAVHGFGATEGIIGSTGPRVEYHIPASKRDWGRDPNPSGGFGLPHHGDALRASARSILASVSSRPSAATDSKIPGDTVVPLIAT